MLKVACHLSVAYSNVDDIDLFIGGLAETPSGLKITPYFSGDAAIGELFATIISDQMNRIKNGDRFWFTSLYVTLGTRLQ